MVQPVESEAKYRTLQL